MKRLNETYFKIKQILGDYTESLESVQLVEEYRRYLKPEEVRIILLAESHVFTTEDDRQITIPPLPELPGFPKQYAKFVYCLGYGEKELTKNSLHPNRDGTPQFWKIFYSCNNPVSSLKGFGPVLGQTPVQQRLRNKINLLKDLKAKGIWLVDASIVALYKDGKKIPSMFSALEESWRSYTREVVFSAKPEHVICIGKGVANIVENDLRRHFQNRYTVIAQPNAHLTSKQHEENLEKYSKICFHSIIEAFSTPLLKNERTALPSCQAKMLTKNVKDTSKYNFDGSEFGKGRLVLAVIKKHVAINPFLNLNSLLEAFPKCVQGSFGVFDTEQNAIDIAAKSGRDRHFINPSDVIALSDGKIAISNQWNPKNIFSFISRATELGYQIETTHDHTKVGG